MTQRNVTHNKSRRRKSLKLTEGAFRRRKSLSLSRCPHGTVLALADPSIFRLYTAWDPIFVPLSWAILSFYTTLYASNLSHYGSFLLKACCRCSSVKGLQTEASRVLEMVCIIFCALLLRISSINGTLWSSRVESSWSCRRGCASVGTGRSSALRIRCDKFRGGSWIWDVPGWSSFEKAITKGFVKVLISSLSKRNNIDDYLSVITWPLYGNKNQ